MITFFAFKIIYWKQYVLTIIQNVLNIIQNLTNVLEI